MRHRRLLRTLLLVLACATTSLANAQRVPRVQPPEGRPALQRLAVIVQKRLGLTDEQSAKLRATTGRFAQQRQQLMLREREARRTLRMQTALGDSADQRAIAQQLDALVSMQQRRVQLVADEQKELAAFLTPLQRAQFLALQERAFRAAQQQRQKRAGQDPLP